MFSVPSHGFKVIEILFVMQIKVIGNLIRKRNYKIEILI